MKRWHWCSRQAVLAGALLAFVGEAHGRPKLELADLVPVDPSPTPTPTPSSDACVAYDGNQALAVYGFSNHLAATWLDSGGAPIGQPFAVGPANGGAAFPQVVFDGANFLVAWRGSEPPGVRLQRVTDAGPEPAIALGLEGYWAGFDLGVGVAGEVRALACSHDNHSSCVVSRLNGNEATAYESFDLPFAVLAVDFELTEAGGLALVETGAHDVVVLEIASDGALQDFRVLESGSLTWDFALPRLAPVAGGFVAAWHRTDGVQLARLSTDGEVGAQQLVAGDGSFIASKLLPTPDGLVLFSSTESDACASCIDVYAQTLSPVLDEPPSEAVLTAKDRYWGIGAASLGSKVLLVSSSQQALESTLVEPAHLEPEPEARPIAFQAAIQSRPVVATAQDGWIVTWTEEESIRGALVDLRGAVHELSIDLPGSPVAPLALEEGGDGWLMAWAGSDGVSLTRLDRQGEAASDSHVLDSPQGVRIVRSSQGWLAVWSRREGEGGSLHADFFDLEGAHQHTVELARRDEIASVAIPFDVASTQAGFRVIWSVPIYGVSSLELDANGQVAGQASQLLDWDAEWLNFASTEEASWLVLFQASSMFFTALPPPHPPENYLDTWYASQMQVVNGGALLAWDLKDDGVVRLGTAEPGGDLIEADVTFPTYRIGGFALSPPQGNQALVATETYLSPFGAPLPRIVVGVLTVTEEVNGEGGAAGDGHGGAGLREGGSSGTGGADSNAGEPSVAGGVAGANHSASAGAAGDVTSDGGAGVGGSKPRLASSCGCRIPPQQDSGGAVLWALALCACLRARRPHRISRTTASRFAST
jgi:hypothetical protein